MTPRDSIDFSSIRVLDGGMATELERRGCDISGPLWSAHVLDQSPGTIAAVHLDYLRAGADCISTASYQVSALGYRELTPDSSEAARRAERALRQSVEIAEQARALYAQESPRRIWIAASLGPYGAALHNGAEYHGRYAIACDDLVAFHAGRLAILAGTNADLIALETIPSAEEAQAILRALESFPALTAWITFTCRDAASVAHGEPLRDCVASLTRHPQVAAVGINCTAPSLITPLIIESRFGHSDRKPTIVYPNSGETWDPAIRNWSGHADSTQFGLLAREWFRAGAKAVGGCCRTGP
ncbi:MAG: homocysteine S-methyltransferase, partial [Acidobacteriaceae bacterium]